VTQQPVYRHDCKSCVFLGGHGPVEEVGRVDLYFCPNSYGGSILSRFGSTGPEYWSAPVSVLRSWDVWRDAVVAAHFKETGLETGLLRAREQGLVPGD
jgi:hypothetical protein